MPGVLCCILRCPGMAPFTFLKRFGPANLREFFDWPLRIKPQSSVANARRKKIFSFTLAAGSPATF